MTENFAAVRVRFLSLDSAIQAWLPLFELMLDEEERQRAERFYFRRDRDLFIAAHALTRSMLSEATGVPARASLRFVNRPYGKPEIALGRDERQVRFNISHTAELVACAVGNGHNIGVDVKTSNGTTDLDIARRYFAPEEAAIVRSASAGSSSSAFLPLLDFEGGIYQGDW